MQAVILAGGYGSRLHPLTQTRPKPLLPLVGVPVLHRILKGLESSGFESVVVTVGHSARQVKDSLKELKTGLEIRISEESTPLGTAGSVRNANRYLEDTFLVIQGDAATDIALERAWSDHRARGGLCTILLKRREDATGLGVVNVDSDSDVSSFVEKPALQRDRSLLVNTGIYVLEPRLLDYIPEGRPFDFASGLFPSMLNLGLRIRGLPVGGNWYDIGTPRTYREASRWLLEVETGKVSGDYSGHRGGLSGGEDMLVAKGSFVQNGLDSWTVIGPSVIKAGCEIEGRAIIDGCVLERGVAVRDGAVLRDSVLFEECKVDSGSEVRSAIVGEGCHLGSGSRVEAAVLGGYTDVRPDAVVGTSSLVPARSVIEPEPAPIGGVPSRVTREERVLTRA